MELPGLADGRGVNGEQPLPGLGFPIDHLSTPISAPSSGQIRRAGSVRADPRTLGMFPLRRLLLATWSIWFPRAQTAIWHTFLLCHTLWLGMETQWWPRQTGPATTLLAVCSYTRNRPVLAQQSLKNQEFRLGAPQGAAGPAWRAGRAAKATG